MMMGFVAMFCVLLVILTVVGEPHKSEIVKISANQATIEVRCSFVHSEVQTFLFALEALIIIYGARICVAVKVCNCYV